MTLRFSGSGSIVAWGWGGLLAAALSLSAADYYVATNATPGSPYNTWASAYTNLQEALDGAAEGDVIRLAGHVFSVTSEVVWTRSGVSLYGGYEATGASPGNRNPTQWVTVITRPAGMGVC